MKIPEWLSTTLSFILIALLFTAYIVSHSPHRAVSNEARVDNVSSTPAFTHTLMIGSMNLEVAYATTPIEQERGLSNTAPLADNQGMLFIFTAPAVTPFWMKDMNYPLDIIWIGADKSVKDISRNLDPETYPKTFSPKEPIQYVLEVPAHFAEKNNINIGTSVSF